MGALLYLTMFLAWVTHIIFCIQAAAYTGSAIALLIVGLVIFPVGVVHGIAIWLGFTWV